MVQDPVNYDYTKLEVKDSNGGHGINMESEKQKEDGNSLITKKIRIFGTVALSQYSTREAVIEHRKDWASVRKSKFLLYAFS